MDIFTCSGNKPRELTEQEARTTAGGILPMPPPITPPPVSVADYLAQFRPPVKVRHRDVAMGSGGRPH